VGDFLVAHSWSDRAIAPSPAQVQAPN
jgi:hypothetical protein